MKTIVKALSVALVCCAPLLGAAKEEPKTGNRSIDLEHICSVRNKLIVAKGALMSADYRGDLAALESLRSQIAPMGEDPDMGYLADYWSGFASWRTAINGANENMPAPELKKNLERAAADFESSLRKKETFADAYAASSSVHGWLANLDRNDPAALKSHIESSRRFQARAEDLDPSNPRVLWVRGGYFLFVPVAHGGDPDKAIEIYRRQASSSGPLTPDSPLPDWGKAEALMSLAFAHLNQPSPDLTAASDEARAALRIQPEWHYVRDILVPQIEARIKQSAAVK